VGDQVGITIKKGDDTYTLDIQTTAASNDTINGVDHDSTPWSKLFQTGETVTFECVTADTDWIVVHDGRKQAKARVYRSTSAQTLTSTAFDQVEFDTEDYNYGMTTDVATNYRVTVRRDGVYSLSAFILCDASAADFLINIYKNGSRLYAGDTNTNGSAREGTAPFAGDVELVAGDYIEVWAYSFGPQNTSTSAVKQTYLTISEEL
jgi:hypothetical protein